MTAGRKRPSRLIATALAVLAVATVTTVSVVASGLATNTASLLAVGGQRERLTTIAIRTTRVGTPTDTATATATGVTPDDRSVGWVARENLRAGSDGWRITTQNRAQPIEGYAAHTSTAPGTSLAMFVNTSAPSFVAQVYRMGWYGGTEARLVWTSNQLPGLHQAPPVVDMRTGLAEARWTSNLTVAVGDDWPAGSYLVKLVASSGDQSYIPFTVRDPHVVASLLVLNAVTTWQAYNRWGACGFYRCLPGTPLPHAVMVSFDRPISHSWHFGSGDFLDHELPVIALAEQQGYDLAYATSVDLHENPGLVLDGVKGILSMGHDEYYSAAMRRGIVSARDAGVNLAFFGANALYRHIRLQPSWDGRPDRVEVDYRTALDPMRYTNRADMTLQWREQGKPEAAIVGIEYACANLNNDLVVSDASDWIWAGAGVHSGEHLHKVIGTEADGIATSSPKNLDLLAASPIRCHGQPMLGRTSYYSAASGAGVFASGTIDWICALEAHYCSAPTNIAPIRAATINVLAAFAQGPAGRVHPSTGRRA